ncbi:MAG TPA: NAD(P)/FAD-dependent oxidoreductase [Candidatus Nitrosocosmicus sp.]|jgi:2-polyprenyl-6-methoxyphenol hydroxylase-like FAD-dependent oxidoreductase|nr:NAD(P)/FAD-dependent oxidoreductase [Candidatus Nitrosocosmicus sp.]
MTSETDVLVIGGGPGGSTAATCLARGGLRVTVVEREAFPRFHIGESLLPANIPLLERLGVMDRMREAGFITKYGAYIHDQESDLSYTFTFRSGKPWPPWAFEVPRAQFDRVLLDHAAAQPGVTICQPARVDQVAFDADGVSAEIEDASGRRTLRARFLVDASGRDGFLASRQGGRREPIPGLGKIALFAHFRGTRRWPGKEEGNIRLYVFEDGWFWWIPFTGDVTSVGCVLHARAAREREGSVEALYEEMLARCRGVAEALRGAERITPVHTAANFSYRTTPVVGDRFVCVGDSVVFIDPIFSTGVFVAMQSAELASAEILRAFRDNRFAARRFGGYVRRIQRGIRPFTRFINRYYEPAFLEVLLLPRENFGILDSVTGLLAGGAFLRMPLRMRMSLGIFFWLVRINTWRRRWLGQPVESRLSW